MFRGWIEDTYIVKDLYSLGWVEILEQLSLKCFLFFWPHVLIGSTVSLRLYRKVCSSNWLNFSLRRLNNLIPLVLCTSKIEFSLGPIKLRIATLIFLIDSVFLILSFTSYVYFIPNAISKEWIIRFSPEWIIRNGLNFILCCWASYMHSFTKALW